MFHYVKHKFRINPLFLDSRKLEPFVDECESLAAKSGIKQIMKAKKYKEQIQNLRDDIASNIQEFTVRIPIVWQHVLILLLSSMDPFQLRNWSMQVCMSFRLHYLNNYSSWFLIYQMLNLSWRHQDNCEWSQGWVCVLEICLRSISSHALYQSRSKELLMKPRQLTSEVLTAEVVVSK